MRRSSNFIAIYGKMDTVFTLVSNTSLLQNQTSVCDTIQVFIVKGGAIHEHIDTSLEIGIGATAAFCATIGVFLILWGGRYFKLFASILTALSAFWGMHYVFEVTTVSTLTCELEFLVAALAAILTAIAVGFLIKFALFAVGAFFFGGAAHFLFQALPALETTGGTPQILGRSLVYYGGVGVSGLIGGIAIRCREKEALEACTSILGGILLSLALLAFVHMSNAQLDGFVYIILSLVATGVGIWFQRRQRLRRKRQREGEDLS